MRSASGTLSAIALCASLALGPGRARAESGEPSPAPVEQIAEHNPGERQEPPRDETAPFTSGVLQGRVAWSGPEPVPAPIARNAEPYCARLGEAVDASISISQGGLAGVLVRLRPLHLAPVAAPAAKRAGRKPKSTNTSVGSMSTGTGTITTSTGASTITTSRSTGTSTGTSTSAAASATADATRMPATRLTLASCAFAPRVLGISPGESVIIESVDPILHALRVTRERSVVYRRTLQREQPAPELRFREAGVYRVGCDVHPWEVAWVVVSPPEDAPACAVTDAQGHFRLEGLAAGAFAIDAWHEQARVTGAPVRIRAGATARAPLQAELPIALAHEEARGRPSP